MAFISIRESLSLLCLFLLLSVVQLVVASTSSRSKSIQLQNDADHDKSLASQLQSQVDDDPDDEKYDGLNVYFLDSHGVREIIEQNDDDPLNKFTNTPTPQPTDTPTPIVWSDKPTSHPNKSRR